MQEQTDFLIEMKAVAKHYLEGDTRHQVLDALNFRIKRGEIIILLGRSGSGKSTLLNLISGIDLPDKGQIIIEKQDIVRMTERQRTLFRRANIGFIFQFFNLIPTLSVYDNLKLPLELNQIGDFNQIDALLEQVDLKQRRTTFPDRLSGGEQQRIAIARALIHNPSIILADEPTGNLDFETGKHIIDLLDRLIRRQGKTMIMATHSRELIGLADRVVSIRNGKLELHASGEFN